MRSHMQWSGSMRFEDSVMQVWIFLKTCLVKNKWEKSWFLFSFFHYHLFPVAVHSSGHYFCCPSLLHSSFWLSFIPSHSIIASVQHSSNHYCRRLQENTLEKTPSHYRKSKRFHRGQKLILKLILDPSSVRPFFEKAFWVIWNTVVVQALLLEIQNPLTHRCSTVWPNMIRLWVINKQMINIFIFNLAEYTLLVNLMITRS